MGEALAGWQTGRHQGQLYLACRCPMPVLPLLSADDLRRTSTAFSLRTASAPDGFHVRHFGLLSDQALGTLAQLLRLIEATGMWPSQVSQLIVALLAKPSGGFRPIGIFPGIYRLWMKSRGGLCMQWESSHELDCFAMGKHRSPVDVVWRQAVRAEASVCTGQSAANLLWDLVKFYESLSHSRMYEEARALEYPLAILRLQLAGYAFPRHLSLEGMVAEAVEPFRGVVAGCGGATTLVKVYYYRPFSSFTLRNPCAVRCLH